MTGLVEVGAPFESNELSLSDYVAIVRRRWWLIATGALVLSLLVFVVSMVQARVYEASSEVLLRTNANEQLFPSVPFTQSLDVRRDALSEVDYIESDQFLAALDEAGASADVQVGVPQVDAGDRNQTGNVLRFTATGSSALAVADSANLAADTYVRLRQQDAMADFERRAQSEIAELTEKQRELDALNAPVAELQQRIELTTDIDQANRLRDQLASLRADQNSFRIPLEQQIDTLSNRVEESQLTQDVLTTSGVSARVNQTAELPSSPTSPKPLRNVLLALFAGAFAGLLATLAWESLDDKLTGEEDLDLLGVTVLASVPVDGDTVDGPRLFASLPNATREVEAYRTARAALNFASEGRLSSFVVTSALPGEGKSTTSANLAVALSQAGQKTLLIDADLRRPTLHKYFGLPNNVGLRSVLEGSSEANDVMTVTGYGDMLALIGAGSPSPYPSELLSSGRLASLIAAAKEVFDVVIVDTPPLFLVADAALVAPAVDGIVLSVTSGMGESPASKKSNTRRLLAAVQRLRTPLLGVVLCGGGQGSYGYGYRYGYYESDSPTTPAENGSAPFSGSQPAVPEPGWVDDQINVSP